MPNHSKADRARRERYDLDYRPTSYWDLKELEAELLSNIKGE